MRGIPHLEIAHLNAVVAVCRKCVLSHCLSACEYC